LRISKLTYSTVCRAGGELREDLAGVKGGDRLNEQRRYRRDVALPGPFDHHRRELVELCRPQDRPRNRTGQVEFLLPPFAREVSVALNSIHPDDG
jgi:hypothetical protein